MTIYAGPVFEMARTQFGIIADHQPSTTTWGAQSSPDLRYCGVPRPWRIGASRIVDARQPFRTGRPATLSGLPPLCRT